MKRWNWKRDLQDAGCVLGWLGAIAAAAIVAGLCWRLASWAAGGAP